MHTNEFTLHLRDENETLDFGNRLARVIVPGMTIWLRGELGAGKTTLSRGLLRGLGFAGKVKSPTYTLVESYVVSGLDLYHFDLYRFIDPDEWDAAGFREYFNERAVCLVEWPEKAAGLLPVPDLEIKLTVESAGRAVRLSSHSPKGAACLEQLP